MLFSFSVNYKRSVVRIYKFLEERRYFEFLELFINFFSQTPKVILVGL